MSNEQVNYVLEAGASVSISVTAGDCQGGGSAPDLSALPYLFVSHYDGIYEAAQDSISKLRPLVMDVDSYLDKRIDLSLPFKLIGIDGVKLTIDDTLLETTPDIFALRAPSVIENIEFDIDLAILDNKPIIRAFSNIIVEDCTVECRSQSLNNCYLLRVNENAEFVRYAGNVTKHTQGMTSNSTIKRLEIFGNDLENYNRGVYLVSPSDDEYNILLGGNRWGTPKLGGTIKQPFATQAPNGRFTSIIADSNLLELPDEPWIFGNVTSNAGSADALSVQKTDLVIMTRNKVKGSGERGLNAANGCWTVVITDNEISDCDTRAIGVGQGANNTSSEPIRQAFVSGNTAHNCYKDANNDHTPHRQVISIESVTVKAEVFENEVTQDNGRADYGFEVEAVAQINDIVGENTVTGLNTGHTRFS